MDADNSFYVKSIVTYAPTFFGYIISVLAMVQSMSHQIVYIYVFSIICGRVLFV